MRNLPEHLPHIPKDYETGWKGQKIAICGYSHYVDGDDGEDVTIGVIQRTINGECKIPFFTCIAKAFDTDVATLFNSTAFMNFVPTTIGESLNKFEVANAKQVTRGRARIKEFIAEHTPEKIFVFSKKAWIQFPSVTENWEEFIRDDHYWAQSTDLGDNCKGLGTVHPQGTRSSHLREFVIKGLAR